MHGSCEPNHRFGQLLKAAPLQIYGNALPREEQAPPENLSITCYPNAKQINSSVGYGACDVPRMSLRRTENDGCIRYRKREIGNKRLTARTIDDRPYDNALFPQPTWCVIQRLPRVVGHACLRRPLQILRNTLSRIVEHAYSNVIPYNSSASFTVGYGA